MEWRGNLWMLALVTGLAIPGCLFAPYTPEAEVHHSDIVIPDPESVSLTTWPQDFLARIGDELISRNSGIEVASASEFRDIVFPDPEGSTTLATLLDPKNADRIKATQAEYLIAFSRPRNPRIRKVDETDLMIGEHWGGSIGYAAGNNDIHLAAAIIDLHTRLTTDVVVSESKGRSHFAAVGVYAVGIMALSEHSTIEALADEVALTLAPTGPRSATRVVLMTATGWRPHEAARPGTTNEAAGKGASRPDE
jgi:hypothetical protein